MDKQNFYLIDEGLLHAVLELLEDMPIRKSGQVIPVIQALRKCTPVNVSEKPADAKDVLNKMSPGNGVKKPQNG